jgi:hypothetical protein
MFSTIRALFLAVGLFSLPFPATAQFNLIELVPGQLDDEYGLTGKSVVEAANGDVLVIYAKNGEITDSSSFPFEGYPATLVLHRKTRGLFWETPVVLDTAIENGVQSLGSPQMVLLPDGRILLTYFYHDALAPNFAVSFRVLVSADHGATWTALNNKDRETASLSVTPNGTIVGVDWVDDGQGNLSFHSSVYDPETDAWLPRGFISSFDPICSLTFRAESETEWHFYYADCFFGYGGSNSIYRMVTTDAGASWSEAEAVFTADSGFGGTLGSIVATVDGNLTAVYSSGTFIAYRSSSDAGATWSEATNWTGDSAEYADISPLCTASQAGPLCLFQGKRETVNQLIYIGNPGLSGDPLLGAGTFALNAGFNDAWFDPETSGQGFLVSVFPRVQQVFLAWFTFDAERPPADVTAVIGEPGHRWMVAQGTYSGETANLTLFVSEGGVFDASDPAPVTDQAGVGTLTLEFADCSSGTVTYDITGAGLSGEIPIIRVANDNVSLCEKLAGLGGE